jgi:hypothetical protein
MVRESRPEPRTKYPVDPDARVDSDRSDGDGAGELAVDRSVPARNRLLAVDPSEDSRDLLGPRARRGGAGISSALLRFRFSMTTVGSGPREATASSSRLRLAASTALDAFLGAGVEISTAPCVAQRDSTGIRT